MPLQRYLAKLEGQPVFNLVDAERYLLLARDIRGRDARLTLRPGAAVGEVVGEVIMSCTDAGAGAADGRARRRVDARGRMRAWRRR